MSKVAVICVDWGTTSFRVWALGRQGDVLAETRNSRGMSAMKPAAYEAVLEDTLADLGIAADVPAMVCGMAGAAQGWKEAPYLDIPADLNAIAEAALRVPSGGRDLRILPGLAKRGVGAADVMRGEETILLGAVSQHGLTGTACLPGTHSKWVRLEDARVTDFTTSITGEIFALLAKHSTLSHFLHSTQGDYADNPAFATAVGEALDSPHKVLGLLFSVRAMPLLMGLSTADDMPARLSGLLIGLEIAGMVEDGGGGVTLIASGLLARSYRKALAVAKLECTHLDSEVLARAGLLHSARLIWPELSE